MGTVTLNKNNRLFWLGRYAERLCQGVANVRAMQDQLIDGDAADAAHYCRCLGVDIAFTTAEEFCQRYCFDRTLSASLASTADAMLGNGMVLRELLGSQTLSYLQMAVSALDAAEKSRSSGVELQWVIDDIMAFRGSYADAIASEEVRNTIKSGASVERVSTLIRCGTTDESLRNELHKLMNRLYKTKLQYDENHLEKIHQFAFCEQGHPTALALLASVESLFLL